jgi:uncharacterized membrane protein
MTQQEPIGRYEETRRIPAPPEQVYAFVSDISNLPSYLPTITWARAEGEDRVRLAGSAAGHQYEDDGFLRRDDDAMRMEWGADERHYSGAMEVRPAGDGSEVMVRLNFREPPKDGRESGGPSEADIREGLQKALQSIENQVTGRGGKEEPRAAS